MDNIKVIVSFQEREMNGPWQTTEVVHSAFEIFNGVFQAVEEFIEVREPETLVFATKRDKLAGVYQTYLRKESATLEKLGYKLEGPQPVDPLMEFTLRRVKPSGWES